MIAAGEIAECQAPPDNTKGRDRDRGPEANVAKRESTASSASIVMTEPACKILTPQREHGSEVLADRFQ